MSARRSTTANGAEIRDQHTLTPVESLVFDLHEELCDAALQGPTAGQSALGLPVYGALGVRLQDLLAQYSLAAKRACANREW